MNPPIDILDVAAELWSAARMRLALIRAEQSDSSPDYLAVRAAEDIAMDDVDTVHYIIAEWPK